ncbi:MAG TPA: hypothetical protein VLV90_12110 [Burkholderiales bacterium]|nr:hypothetical protein [Burkholderiales bacterium]
MTRFFILVLAASLAACGVETATTAATVAEMKRREIEAAKKNLEQAQQKIDAATQQLNQNAAQVDEKTKD